VGIDGGRVGRDRKDIYAEDMAGGWLFCGFKEGRDGGGGKRFL